MSEILDMPYEKWTTEHITKLIKENNYGSGSKEGDELILKIASHPNTDDAWLEDFCLSGVQPITVIIEVAKNPSVDEYLLEELIDNSDIRVKLAVIAHPSCTINILKIASEDKESYFSQWLRESVAINKNTPGDIIELLLKDEHRWVREAASSRESVDNTTITKLIKSGDRYVLKGLLKNPNSTAKIKSQVEEMLRDEETYPIHYIDIAQDESFHNIDDFHPERFFRECINEGEYLYESTDSDDVDMSREFYYSEEYFTKNEINPYGTITYLHKNKFYQISVYIPDYRGCSVNIVGLDEVASQIVDEAYNGIEDLLDNHPWLSDYREIINLLDKIEKQQ